MRLSQFIEETSEEIIAESLAYAGEIPVLKDASTTILVDHLPLVLKTIGRDLEQAQSRRESIEKSLGNSPDVSAETAAQTHGAYRARSGLSIDQLIAEYRVLRSCVLRLWADKHKPDQYTIRHSAFQRSHRPGSCGVGRLLHVGGLPLARYLSERIGS